MIRQSLKKTLALAVTVCAIAAAGIRAVPDVYADNISDTLSSAESRKKQLENKKKELGNELNELEKEKGDIVAYIRKVDGKIGKVSEEIKGLEKKIKADKNQIKNLNKEIEAAGKDIDNQYEIMKKRIKYMYEHGKTEYLDILLEAGSLSDMLSRSEYIQKISEYDDNMLDNYKASKEQLENEKAQLVAAKEELEASLEELDVERDALTKMSDKKNRELKAYNADIKKTENEISANANELDRQEQIINNALLEQQRQIMEAERKKEEARKAAEKKAAEKKAAEEAEKKNEKTDSVEQKDKAAVNPTQVPAAEPAAEPAAPAGNTGGFRWPLNTKGKVTSYFGGRNSPTAGASSNHQGIDIGVAAGTPIVAAKGGTVVTASYSSAAGNYVMINHGGGVFTVYMHASSLAVSAGAEVSQGTVIAYVGSTGVATGNHLHFGLSVGGKYVNPLDYVS